MPVRRPRLTEHSASPPLRDAQPVLDMHHGRALPADACPVRRAWAEDKKERGEPGGHANGAPSQAAKPLPVEPGKTKSYGHGSLDCNSRTGSSYRSSSWQPG